MINNIKNEIENYDGDVSIIVKDIRKNIVIFDYFGDRKVASASIIKVFILLALFDKVNKGHISLQERVQLTVDDLIDDSIIGEMINDSITIEDLATLMIINSDNIATNYIINLIGFDELNNFFSSLGLTNTSINRKMLDFKAIEFGFNNFTSLKDCLSIMEKLYIGHFISYNISSKILNILKKQRDSRLLKRYIYKEIALAHKTGEIPGVLHDMGIVYKKETDYFIGVFLTNVTDNISGEQLIGRISKIVFDNIT